MGLPRAPLSPLVLALLLAAGVASAQGTPPPKLEPLPDIPPPPEVAADAELEPQVTITRREGGEIHEEVRIGGELKFIRVTPRHGRPYYLIPDGNGQAFVRRDSLDAGLKVPLWVLFSW